jgi:hypothetical protein
MENEFLNVYAAKLVEYGLAVVYMILFVSYWRWVQGEPAPGRKPDAKAAGRAS